MISYCKKCLLKDISKEEYFKNVYDYIEHLDEEIKTSKQDYDYRLSLCTDCDNLVNGMCKICGCFVEVRAAKKHNYCPAIIKKW